jgi:hypothetical protein
MLSMEMEKYTPNRAHFFVRNKYTTFSTERIVALRSVNNIFPESYDFAAIVLIVLVTSSSSSGGTNVLLQFLEIRSYEYHT